MTTRQTAEAAATYELRGTNLIVNACRFVGGWSTF